MNKPFRDVIVIGLNEAMSNIVEIGNSSIHLSLSSHTDSAWNAAFNEAWDSVKHNLWRRARATGQSIHIECHHSELHSVHMPYINKAVAKANETFKAVLQQREELAQANKEYQERRAALTQNLKDGFKKTT